MSHHTLARSSQLRHPASPVLETPILVPSFSSCAFGAWTSTNHTVLEVYNDTKHGLNRAVLVSARDIHNRLMDGPATLKAELVFVDSGGYEGLHLRTANKEEKPWTEDALRSILDSWPDRVPGMFVSFDEPGLYRPMAEQIEAAKQLFSVAPAHLHTILIKPEQAGYLEMSTILPHLPALRQFDVIGVTEKELGASVLGKMMRLANLRVALDAQGISNPIHVFGGLDPINALLYFLAGAEIVDGLSWLRYAYSNGYAIYLRNYGMNDAMIELDQQAEVEKKARLANLTYLDDLTLRMRRFLLDGNYAHFDIHAEFLKNTYGRLEMLVNIPRHE